MSGLCYDYLVIYCMKGRNAMKKKWLSGLALALALLLLAGVASAQCQATITYNKLEAVAGEDIQASYSIGASP